MAHPRLQAALDQWQAKCAGKHAALAFAELRDHALNVYEAEIAAGATPEAAAETALAECGEVPQWVEQIRGESYQRRVRSTMRWTTAAVVAGIMVSGSIAIWWPGSTPPPLAVTILQAQQATPVPPKAQEVIATDATEDNNNATRAKLAKYVAADFIKSPLTDVLAAISEQTETETYINTKALEDVGVTFDAPVTIGLKRVRADMLLDLALQQIAAGGIDYVVRDGIIVISTVESLEQANEIKAYPVGDLLALHTGGRVPPGAGSGGLGGEGAPGGGSFGPGLMGGGLPSGRRPSVEQLVDVIRRTVAPESWEETGGIGTITDYGDMLVIRHNERTHREIESLLKLLRETATKKGA